MCINLNSFKYYSKLFKYLQNSYDTNTQIYHNFIDRCMRPNLKYFNLNFSHTVVDSKNKGCIYRVYLKIQQYINVQFKFKLYKYLCIQNKFFENLKYTR